MADRFPTPEENLRRARSGEIPSVAPEGTSPFSVLNPVPSMSAYEGTFFDLPKEMQDLGVGEFVTGNVEAATGLLSLAQLATMAGARTFQGTKMGDLLSQKSQELSDRLQDLEPVLGSSYAITPLGRRGTRSPYTGAPANQLTARYLRETASLGIPKYLEDATRSTGIRGAMTPEGVFHPPVPGTGFGKTRAGRRVMPSGRPFNRYLTRDLRTATLSEEDAKGLREAFRLQTEDDISRDFPISRYLPLRNDGHGNTTLNLSLAEMLDMQTGRFKERIRRLKALSRLAPMDSMMALPRQVKLQDAAFGPGNHPPVEYPLGEVMREARIEDLDDLIKTFGKQNAIRSLRERELHAAIDELDMLTKRGVPRTSIHPQFSDMLVLTKKHMDQFENIFSTVSDDFGVIGSGRTLTATPEELASLREGNFDTRMTTLGLIKEIEPDITKGIRLGQADDQRVVPLGQFMREGSDEDLNSVLQFLIEHGPQDPHPKPKGGKILPFPERPKK